VPVQTYNRTIAEGQSVPPVIYYWQGLTVVETFTWYTSNGSATSGSDYQAVSGSGYLSTSKRTITFPGVQTISDNIYEGPETFSYFITGNQTASNNLVYNFTITDEEDKPRLSLASQTVTEGDSGDKVIAISITASNPAAFNYDITIKASSGTAIEGLDFQPLNTVVRMDAGSTTATASVRIMGNQWNESTETFTITASSSLSAPATATITVLDNDPEAVANVISDVLGTSREYVENQFLQSALASAMGTSLGAFEVYAPYLVELGEGIGSEVSTYYDEVAREASRFSVYSGAFETAGRVAGFASVALSVVETVNVAINDVSRNGEPGHVTSEASARLAAAMLSGAIGEWVGAGVTTMLLPLLATGGALAGAPVVVPILAGVVVGSAVAYGYGQVFDQLAVAGVEHLYKTATNPSGVVSSQGAVGTVGIGNAVPKAAWRYDADTHQLTWLNSATISAFENAKKFVGLDNSGTVIDGRTGAAAGTQTFMGTDGPDAITGSVRNDLIIGKGGNDTIWANSGGKNLVDGGEGHDNIYGGSLRDILLGGNGNDRIDGGAGNDRIEGGDGADILIDWYGDDEILGGEGDDGIGLGRGNKSIDAGAGIDTLEWGQAGHFDTEPLGTNLDISLRLGRATIGFGPDTFIQSVAGIENIEGLFHGSNAIEGSEAANTLSGGILDDRIAGLGGDDHLSGYDGSDELLGGEGNDLLGGGLGLDFLRGGPGSDQLFGEGGGTDVLYGEEGDDIIAYDRSVLIADGGPGFDVLLVLEEPPTYVVPPGADTGYLVPATQVTVRLGQANQVDQAFSVSGFEGADFSQFSAFAGGVTMVGDANNNLFVGTPSSDRFEGSAGNDAAYGRGGDDIIDGGAGVDDLHGEAGNDQYIVDNVGDKVLETAGGGVDRVASSVSYVLTAGQEIERLTTLSNSSTGPVNLKGNELSQTIWGNAGANTLDGGGGLDSMQGFGGNDIYVVDNVGDKVLEAAGGGVDRVASSVSYVLAAGQQVERLDTTSAAGTAAINLTGNEFGQNIIGNAGANTLDGKGGADTMQGLGGDDIYVVDNVGDKVLEAAGGGVDRVASSVSYVLTAGQEIERLTTLSNSSTGPVNLKGNELSQTIWGNSGANVLNGGGGADTLQGLGGNDTFVFRPDEAQGDKVLDFVGNGTSAGDSIRFEGYGTAAQGATLVQLNATQWQVNSADGLIHETLTFSNAAAIHATDFLFV